MFTVFGGIVAYMIISRILFLVILGFISAFADSSKTSSADIESTISLALSAMLPVFGELLFLMLVAFAIYFGVMEATKIAVKRMQDNKAKKDKAAAIKAKSVELEELFRQEAEAQLDKELAATRTRIEALR